MGKCGHPLRGPTLSWEDPVVTCVMGLTVCTWDVLGPLSSCDYSWYYGKRPLNSHHTPEAFRTPPGATSVPQATQVPLS